MSDWKRVVDLSKCFKEAFETDGVGDLRNGSFEMKKGLGKNRIELYLCHSACRR